MNGTRKRMVTAAILACVVAVGLAIAWVLWQRHADRAPPALQAEAERADLILVHKAARRLELWRRGVAMRSYRIALGFDPLGHKQREGDGRTPEGDYEIDWRNPKSRFHLSLHVSYPSPADRAAAAARGESPGGDIMIHGQPNGIAGWTSGHPGRDWTVGCIAVTDREIREIWSLVANGTRITIRP